MAGGLLAKNIGLNAQYGGDCLERDVPDVGGGIGVVETEPFYKREDEVDLLL